MAQYVGSLGDAGDIPPWFRRLQGLLQQSRLPVTSDVPVSVGSIFRLLLSGTGTVTLYSISAAGVVSSALESYTLSAETNRVEYPYLGDDAVGFVANFPATITVEVI